jgi:DNA-binding GntR family transcriptional regulator
VRITDAGHEAPSSMIQYGLVQEAVVRRIRDMIVSGQLRPGDRLRQDDLSSTLGVSIIPIREALRQLQAEGLVTFQPRRGAAVASISVSEYEQISRIREELEILACGWVAEDFDRVPVDRLRKLLAEIEQAEVLPEDLYARMQLVRQFFFTVFEASEKEYLLRLLSNLWDTCQQYRLYFTSMPQIISERLDHYRRMLRACEARDQRALVQAIRMYHDSGRSTLLRLVRAQEGVTPPA